MPYRPFCGILIVRKLEKIPLVSPAIPFCSSYHTDTSSCRILDETHAVADCLYIIDLIQNVFDGNNSPLFASSSQEPFIHICAALSHNNRYNAARPPKLIKIWRIFILQRSCILSSKRRAFRFRIVRCNNIYGLDVLVVPEYNLLGLRICRIDAGLRCYGLTCSHSSFNCRSMPLRSLEACRLDAVCANWFLWPF